jgi:hypothetical protein
MSYDKDFSWQERFIPALKRIVAEHLLDAAPTQEDRERNTDLIVLRLDPVRIACRIRRHVNVKDDEFRLQFTIRDSRPSGSKAELVKVVEGWGDYFLYGFADACDENLCAWVLGDLRVFRGWFMRQVIKNKGVSPGIRRGNEDGSSTFRAFWIEALPPSFVVARKYWEQEPPREVAAARQ